MKTGQQFLRLVGCACLVLACPEPNPHSPSAPLVGKAEPHLVLPHRDRWGDALPRQALYRLGSTRFRHQAAVFALAYAKTPKVLASAGDSKIIRLWNSTTHKERLTLRAHGSSVHAVCFSPDERLLASGGSDGTVRLWDAQTGNELSCFRGHRARVTGVAFVEDGRFLLSAGWDGTIRLWEVASGKLVRIVASIADGRDKQLRALAVGPEGGLVAARTDQHVSLWELHSGKVQWHVPVDARCDSISFSPNGKLLASGGNDHTVQLWDVASGKTVCTLHGHSDVVEAIAFSANGKEIASAARDGTIRFWRVPDGKASRTLLAPTDEITALLFVQDHGKPTVFTGDFSGSIRVWDLDQGKEQTQQFGHHKDVSCVAFHPGGSVLASGGLDDTLRLWDLPTQRQLHCFEHPDSVLAVAFSPDGKLLLSGCADGVLRIWDVDRRQLFAQWRTGKVAIHQAIWSPDGRFLATLDRVQRVQLWDVASRTSLWQYQRVKDDHLAVAFSPDGKTLAVGEDGLVWLVDLASRAPTWFPTPARPLVDMLYTRDGESLLLVTRAEVFRWSVTKRNSQTLFRAAWNEKMSGASLSLDGRILALSSGRKDVLWVELRTGQRIRRFQGPAKALWGVAFSPRSLLCATASADSTILLWPLGWPGQGTLSPAELTHLWEDLGDTEASVAYDAIGRLVGEPEQALPFLRKRLLPAKAVSQDQVHRLLAQLDAEDFQIRERASQDLLSLGYQVEARLRSLLTDKKASAEVRSRAERILSKLEDTSPKLRFYRAIAALEYINSRAATALLLEIAKAYPLTGIAREALAASKRFQQANQELPPK